MATDTEKLSKLKIKLQGEVINAYGSLLYEYSKNAKIIIEKLQYSRKENTGNEIVKIELKREGEYDLILNYLSDIQNKNSREKWVGEYVQLIDRNKELLQDL